MSVYKRLSDKKVNILGQEYNLVIEKDGKAQKMNADGLCEFLSKEIILNDFDEDFETLRNVNDYRKRTLRHELIHAFIYESGLNCSSEWAKNEEMVDFFAIQFPKMVKVFEDLELI